MTHLIIANDSNNASFQVAIRDKECLASKSFLDGAQNGRQLQQEYDAPVLDRYRKELDKALQSLEQHQKLLDAAKQEIGVLQDRTLALQMQLDSSVSSKIKRSAQSDPSSIERLSLNSSKNVDNLDAHLPLLSTADKKVLSIIPDSPTVFGDTTFAPSFSVSPDSLDPLSRMNTLALVKYPTRTLRAEAAALNEEMAKVEPEPTPKLATLMLKPSTQNSYSTQTASEPSSITTVAQLQALIDAAHAGDASALKRVKTFSGSAYQTPPILRTGLQHYVVKHWRKNPRSPSVPAQMKAVGVSFHAEIYVDASRQGIGFVMGGMWSAWRFSDSLAQSSYPFNIGWAEMVAIEVGLWTVIRWATTVVQNEEEKLPLEIDVRCDNKGVVMAVEKRHASSPLQQAALQSIFKVVRAFNVQLSIKWIAGAQNLADNPSRGFACHGMTKFPLIPSLPSDLSDILIPISTTE